jgi:hypothetical protein
MVRMWWTNRREKCSVVRFEAFMGQKLELWSRSFGFRVGLVLQVITDVSVKLIVFMAVFFGCHAVHSYIMLQYARGTYHVHFQVWRCNLKMEVVCLSDTLQNFYFLITEESYVMSQKFGLVLLDRGDLGFVSRSGHECVRIFPYYCVLFAVGFRWTDTPCEGSCQMAKLFRSISESLFARERQSTKKSVGLFLEYRIKRNQLDKQVVCISSWDYLPRTFN